MRTDQTKRGYAIVVIPGHWMLKIDSRYMIEHKMNEDERPDKIDREMAKSTTPPEWLVIRIDRPSAQCCYPTHFPADKSDILNI